MKKKFKAIFGGIILPGTIAFALAGCVAGASSDDSDKANETSVQTESSYESEGIAEKNESSAASDAFEGFSERDFDANYENPTYITLATNASSVEAEGVNVEGNVITFTREGVYRLSGELENGQIIVDLPGENDKIQLVLDGVNVSNTGSAAIYVKNADKVFVTIAEGSQNSISSIGEFVQSDEKSIDGAIFSKDDIVFNGSGSLKVNSEKGHAIVSKNDLKITGGDFEIISGSKALQGKDMVGIAGGDINIQAGTDGIDSVSVAIYDGNLNIKAGDEGINSDVTDENDEATILLKGGYISIESGDDAIQTTGEVNIDGADISIISGGGSVNASQHYDDMMFGEMGGWRGMGQSGPEFGGEESIRGEINYDTDDDETKEEGSKNKGIKADSVTITAGNITIDSQDDAIHADDEALIEGGSININAGDDGIHADGTITIAGGILDITGWEGLEATAVIINDGQINISAKDDGINATQKIASLSAKLEINGGDINIDMAQGDTDALDSNGSLYINGGNLNLNCQSPFDYDGDGDLTGGTVYVNGEQVSELYNQMMGGAPGRINM